MTSEPPSKLVEECMRIVQEHLDREAGNRRLEWLAPRELCAEQKAALVHDIAALLAEPIAPPALVQRRQPSHWWELMRRLWR
ncbi:MAG: hypothetical protein HY331_04810 [Chloroflexi bacterium]|nr:hypothetical protein [Chloroflexota bacterium]